METYLAPCFLYFGDTFFCNTLAGFFRVVIPTVFVGPGIGKVTMRYRLHRDLVLRGIDLKIPSRSKLAFCGRTGCGKSSLFSVLPCLCSGKVFGMKKEQLLSAVGCNMLSQLSHCGI